MSFPTIILLVFIVLCIGLIVASVIYGNYMILVKGIFGSIIITLVIALVFQPKQIAVLMKETTETFDGEFGTGVVTDKEFIHQDGLFSSESYIIYIDDVPFETKREYWVEVNQGDSIQYETDMKGNNIKQLDVVTTDPKQLNDDE